jgi:predicted RNase H-like HicB family nuclease
MACTTTKTYTARATRSGDWWAVEVDELEGVFTQARRLDQVEAMARDAISLLLDVSADSFNVVVRPELPAEWENELEQLRRTRETLETLSRIGSAMAIQTIRHLHHDVGLPMRDIGRILGVSHQRIHQLISTSAGTALPVADAFEAFMSCVDPAKAEKARANLGI